MKKLLLLLMLCSSLALATNGQKSADATAAASPPPVSSWPHFPWIPLPPFLRPNSPPAPQSPAAPAAAHSWPSFPWFHLPPFFASPPAQTGSNGPPSSPPAAPHFPWFHWPFSNPQTPPAPSGSSPPPAAPSFPWFHWPFQHPPATPATPATASPPGLPLLDPKVQNCWATCQDVEGCVHQILSSFWSRNVAVGPACCKAIQAVDDDCISAMFSHFDNPLFGRFIKQFCSTPSASSPPSPPAHA